jgi:hypothetical protein
MPGVRTGMLPRQRLPVPRRFQPVPTPRVKVERVVTIGIGMLASHGYVVAADSQLTTETIKKQHGKVASQWSRDVDPRPDGTALISNQGGMAICVAGVPHFAFRAAEKLDATFNRDRSVSGDELRLAFESTLRVFYAEHVAPFSGGANLPAQGLFELLIAVSRGGHEDLWHASVATIRSVSPYHPIGSGEDQAGPLLSRLYKHYPRLDLAETAIVATFIVHQAKATNIWCGKMTDVACVRDGIMFAIGRQITNELDAIFETHEELLLGGGIWRAVGATFSLSEMKAVRAVRRDLTRMAQRIRAERFFEKTP